MKIFIIEENNQRVVIYLRAEGKNIVGDARFIILPRESFYGTTFGELREMGVGQHEIE